MTSSYADLDVALQDTINRVRAAQLPTPTARKRIRCKHGLSLRAMADLVGVNPMSISRWEQGFPIRADHAIRYRMVLDALRDAA